MIWKRWNKQASKRNYRLRYLKRADTVARRGKLVYVRQEETDVTLFSYIDNVLAEHFSANKEVISALYDEHNRPIF